MSLADEENVQPLLSEQDVETGEPLTPPEEREAPPHVPGDPTTEERPEEEEEEEEEGVPPV